jgi:hypothetical protein
VEKEVIKYVDKPVEVIKEVEKIVHVDKIVEVIKEVEIIKEVIKEVHVDKTVEVGSHHDEKKVDITIHNKIIADHEAESKKHSEEVAKYKLEIEKLQ